ncbi:uncharacterized protein LOC117323140 [Pecten maximus]|uniref:uncharacterized protein LOC117323140 n=1 Tax=Pecten maximus TaxID=6579 RepID=UPI001457E7A7|nr:uncharacterized protein LOC117323140 [Pecten maximus]
MKESLKGRKNNRPINYRVHHSHFTRSNSMLSTPTTATVFTIPSPVTTSGPVQSTSSNQDLSQNGHTVTTTTDSSTVPRVAETISSAPSVRNLPPPPSPPIQIQQTPVIMSGIGVTLSKFNGTDAQLWWNSMESWRRFLKLSEEDTIAALGCNFEGSAQVWLNNLPEESKLNLSIFKDAFNDRFNKKQMDIKFMSIKQGDTENNDTYIARAEKQALGQMMPEEAKVMVIIQGLKPAVRKCVLGKEPKSFADLRHALDIASAELECGREDTKDMVQMFSTLMSKIDKLESVNSVQHQKQSESTQKSNSADQHQPYQQPHPQPYQQPHPQPYQQPHPQPYQQPHPQPYQQPYPQQFQQPFNQPFQQPSYHQHPHRPQYQPRHQNRRHHHNQPRQQGSMNQQGQNRPCGCGVFGLPQMWNMIVMALLCVPVVVSTTSVQRLNYGILFEPGQKLHLGQEYWSHTLKIQLPTNLNLPDIILCKRRTCESANSVVRTLNNLRTQCMADVNETVKEIHRLIPHSYIPNSSPFSSRRSKRGLFDFIGDISKSLFGTATSNDVSNLKRHMQILNNNNVKLAKAMAEEAHQLTSFISTVNDRFDNVIKAVKTNHDQAITLSNQFATSLDGLEHEFVLLENMMLTQTNATTILNKHLEHVKLAIHDLVKGKLSPFLLSPHVISDSLKQVQSIMVRKFPGFNIIHRNPLYYYSFANFLFARHHGNLYILLQIPISTFVKPLSLYKVYSFPVPLNATSTHATQLLGTPDYFFHTNDNQHFSVLSHDQLRTCTSNNNILYCPFHVALSSVAKPSCLSALFYNHKESVKETCDFRFVPNSLSPSIKELSPSTLLLYHITMLALDCPSGQKIIKGCTFCVIQIPCRCSLTSDNLFMPPRIGTCKNETRDISVVHPINLALLQEFFPSSEHSSIFGDTSYSKFVHIKLPALKIYNHSFSQLLANDNKFDLSLKKIAQKAKKGETVFTSLAESMIDGQIPFASVEWPDTSGVIALIGTVVSTIAIVLVFCLYVRFRKLSALLLLAQKSSAFTISPNVPSFHFKGLPDTTTPTLISEHVYNSLLTPWPYVVLSFLTTTFILFAVYIIWKKLINVHKTSLLVELTNGHECELIKVASLPLCPDNWTFSPPMDISNIFIQGNVLPMIHFEWSEFSVINNHTKQRIYPCKSYRLSPFRARKIKRILNQPYTAYILLAHHGYFSLLK